MNGPYRLIKNMDQLDAEEVVGQDVLTDYECALGSALNHALSDPEGLYALVDVNPNRNGKYDVLYLAPIDRIARRDHANERFVGSFDFVEAEHPDPDYMIDV